MTVPFGEIQIHHAESWNSLKAFLLSLYKDAFDFRGQKDGSKQLTSCFEKKFPSFTRKQHVPTHFLDITKSFMREDRRFVRSMSNANRQVIVRGFYANRQVIVR